VKQRLMKIIAKILIFSLSIILIISCGYKYSDKLELNNEKAVFGFRTSQNEIVSICIANDESYIIFRKGTQHKINIEFPINKKDSWSAFKYSYYLRGGGKQNEGLDLNYLKFRIENREYIIAEEYSAEEEAIKYTVTIDDGNKKNELSVDPKAIFGTLAKFRSMENINRIEE
jgi:hypothetical protein